jgi:anti-anti-sigma regulatory factor
VVELHELLFADTSLVVDLAALSRRLRRHGAKLRLRGASPQVLALMGWTGLCHLPGVELEPTGVARI